MRQLNNTDNNANGSSPSDDELIAYLLGSSPVDVRIKIEAWLAADEGHGERLGQFASIMLIVSATSCDDAMRQDRELVATNTPEQGSQARYLIGLLTLAATISIAIFSLRGFRPDPFSDERVALAWAESLPTGGETEPSGDMPVWLVYDGFSADVSSDPSARSASEELADDDLDEAESSIGFSSDEPPEWMLNAVLAMQSDGTLEEATEVAP